jgi:hypothetical protein
VFGATSNGATQTGNLIIGAMTDGRSGQTHFNSGEFAANTLLAATLGGSSEALLDSQLGQFMSNTRVKLGLELVPTSSPTMLDKLLGFGSLGAVDGPGLSLRPTVAVEFGNTADSMAAHPNYVGDLPFSYKAAPFQRFVQRFCDEFAGAGFDDAQGFMQGSAASGVKYSGEALDARMGVLPSDYDVAVVSPKLAQRAQELGLNVFNGPLTADEVGALGLTDAQNALSAASKYQLPVNFKIYDSAEAVFDAQKTIPFSDWMK